MVIVLTVCLLVMAVYDVLFACRPGGDPTEPVAISSAPATTYNNPGFREGRRTNGKRRPPPAFVTDPTDPVFVWQASR